MNPNRPAYITAGRIFRRCDEQDCDETATTVIFREDTPEDIIGDYCAPHADQTAKLLNTMRGVPTP